MSEVIEKPEIEYLMKCVATGWVVSKPGGDTRSTYDVNSILGSEVQIRSRETGTLMTQPIEKLLAHGYTFTPPQSGSNHTAKLDTPMTDAMPAIEDAPVENVSEPVPMKEEANDVREVATAPIQVMPAEVQNPEDPAASLMAQWEAERSKVDEKFRQKIIDARRKSKSTPVRREEALAFMDGLRDLIRGNDIGMVDEDIDRAISAVIQEKMVDGSIHKLMAVGA